MSRRSNSNSNPPGRIQNIPNSNTNLPRPIRSGRALPAPPKPVPQLPGNIYTEISRNLSVSDKAAFRRANTLTFNATELYQHECVSQPTNSEISRWLLQQQELLRQDISSHKSRLWDYKLEPIEFTLTILRDYTVGQFVVRGGMLPHKIISFSVSTGDMFLRTFGDAGGQILTSFEDIMDALTQYPLDYVVSRDMSNWHLIKGVLRNRLSCFKYGITLFDMMKSLLASTFLYESGVMPQALANNIHNMKVFLTKEASKRLISDFSDKFGVPQNLIEDVQKVNDELSLILKKRITGIFTENMFNLDSQEVIDWLNDWILRLTLEDMDFKQIFNND